MPVDPGTLPRVDPGQFGAVGGRDRRADRTVALSYTGALTQTACWEGRSQVCDEIRLTLAEVRRRTPSAVPAWGPRGTTPRLTVRGTAAGAPPPPPPPPPPPHLTIPCLHKPPKHNVAVPINKVEGRLRGANPVGGGVRAARHPMRGVGKGFGAEGGFTRNEGGGA